MDIEIVKDVKNELLHRRELEIIVKDINATVSRQELKSLLVPKLGENQENFVLDKVNQEFGEKKLVCNAKVYEDINYLKKYEPKFRLERGKPKETEKKEEPVETPKEPVEEKPKEETKETPKETEKKEETKEESK